MAGIGAQCKEKGRQNYRLCFKFEYGPLDDGTIWIRPPSGNLFHIDKFTFRIVLELNSGMTIGRLCKKYHLTEDEIIDLLHKFKNEQALVRPKQGKIKWARQKEDISLLPYILLAIALGIIQGNYFRFYAHTYILDYWYEGLLVAALAIAAVPFHEIGHYLASKPYFKPKFGFTFLWLFPALYVDTHSSWCLPRNIRLLISFSGLLADLVINTIAVAIVMIYPPFEYFVTPFLIAQYTRWSIILNPLFPTDSYWILADLTKTVNLGKKGLQSLMRLRMHWLSLYGLLSLALSVLSTLGIVWLLYNILHKAVIKLLS